MTLIPLIVLNQCLTSIGQETGKALIATVCSKTENPQDCISLLESDPRSFTSNLTGLARIALEITARNARNCRDFYIDSVGNLWDSLRAFDELKFDKSYQSLQYVIGNVTDCQNTPLDDFNGLNATMLKITKYVLAILHQLF
ncbi:Pectinesterase inhibitor [Corchorus olitorius]|uniref:Pectinesterase inhibitor n=1 Tax=Corchorus olitorius TaxID=93759 RepID=A0A1R3GVP4_9ROSI|nr:Pectinesterase inhibitor [Corchorus olitorius]